MEDSMTSEINRTRVAQTEARIPANEVAGHIAVMEPYAAVVTQIDYLEAVIESLSGHNVAETRDGITGLRLLVERLAARTMTTELAASALASVRAERLRQQEKWGTQRHSWPEWMAILGEEYGEACQAVVHATVPHDDWTVGPKELLDMMRTELVHTAAVAVQIIEHIDEVQR
jgi:hypothetical protein